MMPAAVIAAVIAFLTGCAAGSVLMALLYLRGSRDAAPQEADDREVRELRGKLTKTVRSVQTVRERVDSIGPQAQAELLAGANRELGALITRLGTLNAQAPPPASSALRPQQEEKPVPMQEPPQENRLLMADVFRAVSQLRQRSPQYREYNASTNRLEGTADPGAAYIQHGQLIFPNQVSGFRKTALHDAVYGCQAIFVKESLQFVPAYADEFGNILKRGSIIG